MLFSAASQQEPPAPAATAAVQSLLDDSARLAKENKAEEALQAAERAVSVAGEAKDVVGEALAQRERALRLAELKRPAEAQEAWGQAGMRWKMVGDGPGQVEALAMQALLLTVERAADARALLNQAVVLAQAEKTRPQAAARQLNELGKSLEDVRKPDDALEVYKAALAIQEEIPRESLDLANSLHGLGRLRIVKGDLTIARDYFQRSLAIQEKLVPGSLDVVRTLNDLGVVAGDQGDLTAACDYYQRALAIEEKLAPDSLHVVGTLNDLGNVAWNQGDWTAARDYFQRALAIQEKLAPGSLAVVANLNDLAFVAGDQGDLTSARDYYQHALEIQEKLAPGSLDVARTLNNVGIVADDQGDLRAARDYHQRALTIQEKLVPGSLDVAASLNNLGNVAWAQGDLTAAHDYYQRALAIREKQAPGSLDVAASLNSFGNVAWAQGDLTAAHDYYQRALAIREKLAPGSLAVANSLNGLGVAADNQGDLTAARDYHQRALAIREKLAPSSLDVAASLGNLGIVAYDQGDLTAARDYHQRALRIQEKLVPGSLDVAASLNNLGNVAYDQGDLTAARDCYQRALAIREKLAPGSLDVAVSLNNLGAVAQDQGDLTAARDYHQRALAIREKLAPASLGVAGSLHNLGGVAYDQGDLTAAHDYLKRALAIQEKLAPGSLNLVAMINGLGEVARKQGDLTAARDYLKRALAIGEKQAPGSLEVARSLNHLGIVAYDQGDLTTAAQLATRAWTIIREQASVVSGDEARQAFGSYYANIGANLVRYQVALGRTEDAFVTLEEGRAQALQQMLRERDTAKRHAPAEVWRAYEEAQRAYDLRGKALEKAGEAEARAKAALDAEIAQQAGEEAIAAKRQALAAAQKEREQVEEGYTQARVEAERRWGEVRQAVKALLPPPVDVKRARELIPSGVAWVEFSVGEAESTVFVVRGGGQVAAYPLQVPLKELEARVDFVRRSVSREVGERDIVVAGSEEIRLDAARTLYQKLFPAGAREAIAGTERVVLSPDGVLWELPFAALVTNDTGPAQYLGLEKPLVYAQSLAVFAQAASVEAGRAGGKGTVLVVGNPLFDNARRADLLAAQTKSAPAPVTAAKAAQHAQGELALLSRDGMIPVPLPHAEEEAREVAALYGVKAWSGAEPTEKWFRERAGEAEIIHLATHGYFNPILPMSSGVILAVPEQEAGPGETDNDGALQAWEIMSQIHLKAELVVLSACETGLGKAEKGEGLVGLTRAFQVAGARSVVASQWRVSDRSTARLMVAFHESLRAGVSKDEALRRAMVKVAKDPTTADPYFWAAFLLVGDYRGK
jgi:CHAT domain-containing protein/Tfp pilus assembly protein PilF